MKEETLYRYASNSMTDAKEIEEVLNWIEASPENKKEFSRIKNQWAYAGFRKFDALVKENTYSKPTQASKIRSLRFEILRYAAIFILAFCIGGGSLFLLSNRNNQIAFNEIIVPLGETSELILSDQTHVWLNSGAHLSYPSQFNSDLREVKLSGEAYFEVKRNEKSPFHVITENLTVNVLGTSFNVEAYTDSKFVNVTLVEGKVSLENNEGKLLTVLNPDQNAKFNVRKNSLEIEPVNTCFYTSWREGSMSFKDEKLVDIAAKLERWFNVEIVFEEESVKNYRFSGSVLKNKPIDQVLEILKFTAHIDYSVEMNNQSPNIIHFKSMPMTK